MSKLTKQQVFDKVYRHFVFDGGKKSVYGGSCKYRDKKGGKCAIGVLIPDNEYSSKMECQGARELLSRFCNIRNLFAMEVTWDFLQSIQQCHDFAALHAFDVQVKNSLTRFAVTNKLKIPRKKSGGYPSKQRIFNKVWRHFITEKNQPAVKLSACYYRLGKVADGPSCAIGCLIPNKEYTPDMECGGITRFLDQFPEIKKYTGANTAFLRALQSAHDTGASKHREFFYHNLEYSLRRIAKDWNLTIPAEKG